MPININNKNQIRTQIFNRGQNSNDNPLTLVPGFAQLLENAEIDKAGDIVQRKGTTRTGDNPDTLISKWTFNAGDAADDKGSNTGSVASVTFEQGKFGKAAGFNGSTSSITVSADTTIDINSTGPLRVSAWVYVDTDGENDIGSIADKFSGTDIGYRLWVHSETASTVKLSFEVGYVTTNAIVVTSTTISTGAWHKIDALINTDDSADIYINGAIASYSTDTSGVGGVNDDSAVDLVLGNNGAGSATFDGKLDDVRFYDGSFTAAQLAQDKVQGLTRYTVGATVDRVYRIINTTLQNLDDNFKDWTDIDTGFTADLKTNFVQALDKLFILNGTDNVHSMASNQAITDEGNTNTDAPRTTVGEYMSNNRLFLGGSLTESTRDYVWFSDTLLPQTFDRAVNVIKVRSGGGGAVTELVQFRQDELIIYKEDSIYILFTQGATPLTDWTLDVLNPTVGCKAGRTVANLRNEHIFLDSEGNVRLLTRTEFDKYRYGVISDGIKDVLADINLDQIDKSVGYFHDEKYYLFFPTGANTEPNKGVVWDSIAARLGGAEAQGWSVIPDANWYPAAFTEFEFSDNNISLLYADNRDISVVHHALNGKIDDGKAITMKIRGPIHTSDFARQLIWNPLLVTADSTDATTITIRGSLNNQTYVDLAEVAVDSSSGIDLPLNLPVDFSGGTGVTSKYLNCLKRLGRGRGFSIEIEHNQYNKTVTFKEYTLFGRVIG